MIQRKIKLKKKHVRNKFKIPYRLDDRIQIKVFQRQKLPTEDSIPTTHMYSRNKIRTKKIIDKRKSFT